MLSHETAAARILLTATLRWPIAARLAIAFARLGCRVEAVCAPEHPATVTRAIDRVHPLSTRRPLASLRLAIEKAAPDLLIPCDDDAAHQLAALYRLSDAAGHPLDALRALLARSLGTPGACAFATNRGCLMGMAAQEGVRTPQTAVVTTPAELLAWLSRHQLPAVIKVDGSWGGQGVAIVCTHDEARCVFARMSARASIANAAVRLLLDRDPSQLLGLLEPAPRSVTVQDYITGMPANRAVACWQGRVLAGISVQALATQHPTGPATVVRVIDNDEMTQAVTRLVRRLGLSGLWGADFVLEAATGAAHLIEINPRATPICHLPLGAGHDLPAALCAQLTGRAPPPCSVAKIEHEVIALFPGEWKRLPMSPHLREGYHDVPWEEPALVRDCIDLPWAERGLLARGRAALRAHLTRPAKPNLVGALAVIAPVAGTAVNAGPTS